MALAKSSRVNLTDNQFSMVLSMWSFFASGLNNASNSLVSSANRLKKVYFPRLAIPLSSVLAGMIDFLLAVVVLLGMRYFYGLVPTMNILWLSWTCLSAEPSMFEAWRSILSMLCE